MDTVYFDGQWLPAEAVALSPSNRGLAYSDGFFETMIWTQGHVRFIHSHLKRAERACEVLGFQMNIASWLDLTAELIRRNGAPSQARIKAMAWRKEGGLYAPTQTEAHFLLRMFPWSPSTPKELHVDVCRTVQLPAYGPLSGFKKLAALPYVVAGLECSRRQLDELVLCNERNKVAECISSNLFWLANDEWHTPSLTSGCLPGVMRGEMISLLKAKEALMGYSTMAAVTEAAFVCNAAGIHHVVNLSGNILPVHEQIVELAAGLGQTPRLSP